MMTRLQIRGLLFAGLAVALPHPTAFAQHGVIREYAALAPAADAVPLRPLFDAPLTDASLAVGPDGVYCLTGTSGNMDGINLWRSPDLRHFAFVKQVWTPPADPASWYNSAPNRLHWAPELHFIHGTCWIAHCLSAGIMGKNGLLKSASGKAEGPYEPAFPGNRDVDQPIDSSLFRDTSGRWLATFFGNDRTAPFRAMPGYVPVDTRESGNDLVIEPQAGP